MKPSVILYKTLPDDLQQRLEQHFTVTQVKNLRPETVSQHAAAFAEAVGLLGSSEKVDTALLEKMPKLRATSTISVGYDNFDVDALNARKVLLMHTPTVLTETVADTVMALVLSTARRVVEVANRVKAGEWTKSIGPDWFGNDVHHKTLGIVGMGRIGMALAQRAHAGFGMPILYNARRQHPQAVIAIGPHAIDGTARHPIGDQRQQQGGGVRHHVAGVRDQGQRAGHPPADGLNGGVTGGEDQDEADAPLVIRRHHLAVVVPVALIMLRRRHVHLRSFWMQAFPHRQSFRPHASRPPSSATTVRSQPRRSTTIFSCVISRRV